ncbi:hypothetical protein BOTBODRAFT_489051 [Botryobasidium botryosum FD-172 SS1]|uniref:Aminodeoxychorismate lyase n=1 Tax=Botryobasidium botryosum (strain FD-172 SS1) TaxID=930990 RepID=A0A067M4P1_BOTB1|nr:hypothetical protein BOTBODRAFT_489051 [Botryobasidium botryosum FD-172 SS1]
MSSNLFQLITSLRYDPLLIEAPFNQSAAHSLRGSPFLPLVLHRDRLLQAAGAFGWDDAAEALEADSGLQRLRDVCEDAVRDRSGPQRLRILLSESGELLGSAYPTDPRPFDLTVASTFNPSAPDSDETPYTGPIISVYIDTESTPQSMFTSYKTTSREHYTAARTRAEIAPDSRAEEVLLWNERGEITEGSIRNVAFWRDGGWVTPSAEGGCLAGVMRRWLIESERVREGRVLREEVVIGEWVLLSNGVEGCSLGKVFR